MAAPGRAADGLEHEAGVVASKALASGDVSADDFIELQLRTIAGKTTNVRVSKMSSIGEVLAAAEAQLRIPARSQRWLRDDTALSLDAAASLADYDLRTGDSITVVHHNSLPLIALPEQFTLKLTSARFSRIRTSASSAFTLYYLICGDVPKQKIKVEPWRKNDHDKIVFDGLAQTKTSSVCHWMSGTQERTSTLKGRCPLTEFVAAWSHGSTRSQETSDLFWWEPSHTCESEKYDGQGEEDQAFPSHSAVPGWFIAPHENCMELKVDIALPTSRGARQRIIRLLIDEEGKPLRAAVKGCGMGGMHEDIEEYDVEVQASTSAT